MAGAASEPSAMEIPQQKGVFCAPAIPTIDQNAFEALTNATGTELPEWGYPNNGGLDVHATAQPSSPVIEKVGMVLVRVLPDSGSEPNQPLVLHIATPSGKPALSTRRRCRRWSAIRCATPRMPAAGRLPAISAASRRNEEFAAYETVLNRRRARGDNGDDGEAGTVE